MAHLIRHHDWSATPLGPVEKWSSALRHAVELIVPSGFPMIVLWGGELVQIYNDHYRDLMGNKHPTGLGRPTWESWPEVWNINAPIYKRVRAGETLTFEDALYPITRSGELKDAWFTLSYSPLHDDGAIGGVLVTVFETTGQHQASTALRDSEERQAFLLELTDALRPLAEYGEIERAATRLLGEHLKADRCFLSPVYEDGLGMYVREEYLRSGASSVLGDYTFAQFGDFVGPELHAGRMLAVEDVSALTGLSAAERASYAATEIQAYLLIPVTREGRLAAFLTINHRTPRSWSDADKAVARQTADRLWTARERARVQSALHESEELRRVALNGGRMGAWQWDLGERLVWGDDQFMALFGLPPTKDGVPLALFTERMSVESAAEVETIVTRAIAAGEEFDGPIRLDSGPTAGRWVQWRGRPAPGDVSVLQGVSFDITDQKLAELLLRESEDRLATFFASAPVGLSEIDAEGRFLRGNDELCAMLKCSPERLLDLTINDVTVPDDLAASAAAIDRVQQTGATETIEKHYIGCTGHSFAASSRIARLESRIREPRLLVVTVDLTERRRIEAELNERERRLSLLLAELQHRVRNTLAVVRSIARRTAENSTTVDEMLAHFQGRLDAFLRVQAALTRNADARIDLTSLIEDELIAHAAREGRHIRISGPEITLAPKAAERMSLAIHELTTNAVKHGALSGCHGHIDIRWTAESNGRLILRWKEWGAGINPELKRRGFGMELLLHSLPYDLQATTTLEFNADGLDFELNMPMPGSDGDG